MKRKDLTGLKVKGANEREYIILLGSENSEAVYGECESTDAPLNFCCDTKIINGRLKATYCVSYTVNKEEFFDSIDSLENKCLSNIDSIAAALRKKYYKIPTAFLKLVAQVYFKERE